MFGRRKRQDESAGLYDDHYADHDWDQEWDDDSIELGGHTFASDRRRRPWTTFLGCLLPLGLVGLIAGGGYYGYQRITDAIGSNTCKVRDDRFDYQWTPEQVANAGTISLVGNYRFKLPTRAAQIANATAIQESKLRNLRSGDRDSLGLFQQRPSMGWGSAEEILDPVYASTKFYDALVKVEGWQTRPLTQVAQDVQKSGFPEAYADHETQGRVLATAFDGSFPGGVACRLDDPTGSGSAADVVAKLRRQADLTAIVSGTKRVVFRGATKGQAWGVAHWAVGHAQAENITAVTVGDRTWTRQQGKGGWQWSSADRPTGSADLVRIDLA